MNQKNLTQQCASNDAESKKNSRNSHSPETPGVFGSFRENKNGKLPRVTDCHKKKLCNSRENREFFSLLHACKTKNDYTCDVIKGGVEKTPKTPETPSTVSPALEHTLWTALIAKRNIYDIARCLKLSADCSPQSWRLAVLGLAKSDQFFEAKPSEILLRRQDWERWRSLKESPRKMLDLLRKIIYGVKIWD